MVTTPLANVDWHYLFEFYLWTCAETPLWRHGPTEKPLLCNACGSRWRLKGTLDDYTPKRYRSVVRKRKFQNTIDVHEEESIVDTVEVTLGDLNFNELLASNNNKSSSESTTSESHQLIKFKAVAESENPGHPVL